MNLFENLPINEVDALHKYLKWYNNGTRVISRDNMDYFLREWSREKEHLYKIFGNKFILEREIEFNKSQEEFQSEISRKLWGWGTQSREFLGKVQDALWEVYYDKHEISSSERDDLNCLFYTENLISNIYPGRTVKIPGSATKSGKPLTIQNGCKVVKALKKLGEEIGCSDYYEEFRRTHSMILNQKKIKGTICLSIHPLDYITISDNDYNWSSCMCWVDEPGDYRVGTLEMMNSHYVVVAYLKGSEPGQYFDGLWNNKKWRQLIIATPDLILGNKQYPYENNELQAYCLKWLKRLFEDAGYGNYYKEIHQIVNSESNYINGERKVYINLSTCMMYNDVYDERAAFVGVNIGEPDHQGEYSCCYDRIEYCLNFSGRAICTGCGCYIDECDVEGTSSVCCCDCDTCWHCSHCGDSYRDEPAFVDEEGYRYCEYCVESDMEYCECCGSGHFDMENISITFKPKEGEVHDFFNFHFAISMCPSCFNDKRYEEFFGPLEQAPTSWGGKRTVFYLENITDEGMNKGELADYQIDLLKRLRDTEDLEERRTIWHKELY